MEGVWDSGWTNIKSGTNNAGTSRAISVSEQVREKTVLMVYLMCRLNVVNTTW